MFRNALSTSALWCLVPVLASVFFLAACGENQKDREVVVYTSVDDIFARPVAEEFEKRTAIRVKLVTDTEETKSTGLLNRLIAEKNRPVADVFWSGDPARAALLKIKGVSAPFRPESARGLPERFSDPDGHWIGFSTRARMIIYNKDLVRGDERPVSIFDLTSPRYKGRACIANPLFGTTSMHAAALFQVLGEEKARAFFNSFAANGGQVLASNGDVKNSVAKGMCALGLTDSDDVSVAVSQGLPVGFVFPDQDDLGTLLIPNCAVLIKGAPHRQQAEKFIDFLLSPDTARMLAKSKAAQIPLRPHVQGPEIFPPIEKIRAMKVDYQGLAHILDRIMKDFLKKWADENS